LLQRAKFPGKVANREDGRRQRERDREDSKRTPERIAAKKKANTTSNARRSKGGDRSAEQVAAAEAANDKRAKGIHRSAEQVAAAEAANEKRAKGIQRSAEQVAAAEAANIDRAQGSDRSSQQVSTVKEANKKYYLSGAQREERKRFKRWASYQRKSRTRFECLFDDATEVLAKHDYRAALLLFKEARTLIPKPDKYVHLHLVQYCMVHGSIGSILFELGDMHGAIESLNEALRMAAFKNATDPDGQLTQENISLSSILQYKVYGICCVRRLV